MFQVRIEIFFSAWAAVAPRPNAMANAAPMAIGVKRFRFNGVLILLLSLPRLDREFGGPSSSGCRVWCAGLS